MVVADFSYVGPNGIGRFASEVLTRCEVTPLAVHGSVDSPLYSFWLAKSFACSNGTLLFSPSYMPPLWAWRPFIFTIHDLNHIDRPENSSFLKRLYYKFVMRRACLRAAAVLTVSDFSRRRIVEWSGVSATKVFNVGNGVGRRYQPAGDVYQPGYDYFLCVSNRKAHKNEERTIKAFASSSLSPSVKLIMSGVGTKELISLIRDLGIIDRVVCLGRIEETEMPNLYRGALGVIFVSMYEGFGLPIVEAMACGIPVITSNCTAMPEVAGGAALLVDPLSLIDITNAINRVGSDELLRSRLKSDGLIQAQNFTWDKVAENVKTIFRRAEVI